MKRGDYNGYNVYLIQSVQEMFSLKEKFNLKVKVGLDTETTGLDYDKDKVVGVCVSGGKSYTHNEYSGYYIPIRHEGYDKNLPIPDVIKFVQWLVDNASTCLFNRNFDASMLEKEGFIMPFVGRTHDVQIMAHLATNDSMPALKEMTHNYLKLNVIEFSSNNAKNHNFGTTDPEVSFVYGAQDPLVTVMLGRKLWADYPYIRKIYPLDNKASEAIRHFSNTTKLYLDFDKVKAELDKTTLKLSEVRSKIFAFVGYQFKLNSNRDKGDALSRYVTLTQKTKSGALKVDKEVLERIDHPLAKMLVEYNKLEKYATSYLKKMFDFPKDGFHVNYSTVNVSTGRMSSGSSKGNQFFANLNIQNIPKVELYRYVHRDDLLGYVVTDDPEGAIGKMKVKGGLRDAFICPKGYYWMCADYAAQEMRLIANFSGEPNYVEPIKNGLDIHNYIAKKMFGYEDPNHRTSVKVLNFATNYGAAAPTIARKLNISIEKAQELLDNYNAILSQLTRWKQEVIKDARHKGIVYTYFGRPRLLYKYYSSSDNSLHAFADRTAINSPVQGTGGDLIRLDHVLLYNKFLTDKEFADNCMYAITVHDEINLFFKPNYMKKAYDVLKDIMYYNPSNFKVPLVAEPAIGTSWGTLVEADGVTDDNKIILNESKLVSL